MSKQQHHYSVTGPDGRTHLCKTPQQCNQKYLELYPQGGQPARAADGTDCDHLLDAPWPIPARREP